MGRRESPLDPEAGPVQRFAHQLRTLRQESGGITYRAMAERVEYSAPTLSEAAAGERLPSLPVVLAYVAVCGGDLEEWERRWRQAALEEAAQPPRDDGAVAPYRGLARFEPGDRDRFFGRDRLVGELAELAKQHRFAGLVGTSGSGKSSLLRAGLIPALQDQTSPTARPATIRILTPGANPATAHAHALIPMKGDGDTWVVVDQFEEVFTLCQDPVQRKMFIDLLLTALQPGSRVRVVIAVRADFYGHCADHRDLADALRAANLLVGPMNAEELREAIVKPAMAEGLNIERALTARIIADVDGQPGALPMMSHALFETWRRRRGRTLSLKAYEAAGGVHGAIADTAEQVYTHLSPGQATLARRLLLRLIAPGEGAQDTRRPAHRAELADCGPGPADTALVLDQLARARLVTLHDDTVDLAHEALITSWPRLHTWIEEDRELLRHHRALTEATTSWGRLDRDPGALYRGTRLATAEETFTPERQTHLTELERCFLTTSLETRDHEHRQAARTTRHLRTLVAALSALVVLALSATALAYSQRQSALTAQSEAVAAQREALSRQLAAQSVALLDSDPDLASLLAIQAYRTNPTREATTSVYAAGALPLKNHLNGHTKGVMSVAFSPDGKTLATGSTDRTIRLWDTATGTKRTTITNHAGAVDSVAFSPDGKLLAAGSSGRVQLWDIATKKARAPLTSRTGKFLSLAFSPAGEFLAAGDGKDTLELWDPATGHLQTRITVQAGQYGPVTFSPDGRTVATGTNEGTVHLWNTATGESRKTLAINNDVIMVAYSPKGDTIAVGTNDGMVQLWDPRTGTSDGRMTGLRTPALATAGDLSSLAFSSDGVTLAVGSSGRVQLWDIATGKARQTLVTRTGTVSSLAFSPDGTTLASGSAEQGPVLLWNLATGHPRKTITSLYGDSAVSPDGTLFASGDGEGNVEVRDVPAGMIKVILKANRDQDALVPLAFSPDHGTLATGSYDGAVKLWDLATGKTRKTIGTGGKIVALATARDITQSDVESAVSAAYSADGTTLAISSNHKHSVTLWDTETGKRLTTLTANAVTSLAFSPDGTTLAAGYYDGTVTLWALTTGKPRTRLPGHTGAVATVAFSPDGTTLATSNMNTASAGSGHTVWIWDTATGRTLATLTGHTQHMTSMAFTTNGRTLATSSADGTIRLWDLATRHTRAILTDEVTSMAFTPDGRALVAHNKNASIQLWDTALPGVTETINNLCKAIHRDLTNEEQTAYLPHKPAHPTCPT